MQVNYFYTHLFSYLKLIPIRPWDDNYNISVWFINLKGTDDENIIQEAVRNFNFLKDKENIYNWLSLTRQIFKEQSCEILKLNQINPLIHVLEGSNITKIFEFLMRGQYEKAIKTLKKMENENSYDIYLRELPYILFYRRLDFVTDEINNIIVKAKVNDKIINHFKINWDDEYLSDNLSEDEFKHKLKKPIIEITQLAKNNSNIESDKSNETVNNVNIQEINTNTLVNQIQNLLSNINNNELNNNQEDNENEINEGSELNNYDLELNELKLDSLFSQNDDLDDSNFELNFKNKMDESLNKNMNSPCGRGGHTMVLDEENSIIYLFGGWDGTHELDDFWCFDVKNENDHGANDRSHYSASIDIPVHLKTYLSPLRL